jgi:tetratricopeptide (TPR) repeat protein
MARGKNPIAVKTWILAAWGLMLANAAFAAEGAPANTATWQAIAATPTEPVMLLLDKPDLSDAARAAFDQAFIRCREALSADPASLSVRVNLSGLYLFRDDIHPEETGNFEKAINQLLIIIQRDPGNQPALSYLRENGVVGRIIPAMAAQGLERVRAVLQEAWTIAPSSANLWPLAQIDFMAGRISEAELAASKLVTLAPQGSSFLLLGAVKLKAGHPEQALDAFESATQKTATPLELAVAKLGIAQSCTQLGTLEKADQLWNEATKATNQANLERAAISAGILPAADIGTALGKAWLAAGEVDRAVVYLGAEVTNLLIERGNKAWSSGNRAEAIDAYLGLVQLEPERSDTQQAIGLLSFELRRYRDSVSAFHQAVDLGATLSANMLIEQGVSCLALSDYEGAFNAFDEASRKEAGNSAHAWRIGAAFAIGGWDRAIAALKESPPSNLSARDPSDERLTVYDLVYDILTDADQRAKEAGLTYPRLNHLSLLYELDCTSTAAGRLEKSRLRREMRMLLTETIELYAQLPLKPTPPRRALAEEAKAETAIRTGRTGAIDASRPAILATEIAPWWPEARYNLGVYLRDSIYTQNRPDLFSETSDGIFSNEQGAAQEFAIYLRLSPDGPKANEVRQQLKRWNLPGPK